MSMCVMRAGLAFLLLGSVCRILCQTESSIDSAVYLSFFREAAHEGAGSHPALKNDVSTLNGEPTDLIQPSIQEAMGITDREAQALIDEASVCEGEIDALEANARALVFESRLRAANDDQPSDALAQQMRELEVRRVRIVMSHVERLKGAMDAGRFKAVEDYIRSRRNSGSFFPAVHAKKP